MAAKGRTMNAEIQTTTAALAKVEPSGLAYSDDQWEIVRRNFFPADATPDEVAMCQEMARRSGLDVLKRQCYFWRDRKENRIVLVASVHGMRAQALRRGFVIQSAAVHENDEFLMDPIAGQIKHLFRATNRGPVVGAWARTAIGSTVLSRYVTVAEYRKQTSTWTAIPATMIQKTAIAQVARDAVPDALGDVYGAEEFGSESHEDGTVLPLSPPADPDAEAIAADLEVLAACETLAEVEQAAAAARASAKTDSWSAYSKRLYKGRLAARQAALKAQAPAPTIDATAEEPPAEVALPLMATPAEEE